MVTKITIFTKLFIFQLQKKIVFGSFKNPEKKNAQLSFLLNQSKLEPQSFENIVRVMYTTNHTYDSYSSDDLKK